MTTHETFANKLMTLVCEATWQESNVDILAALDDQRANVLRWIEAERRKTDEYLSTRKP